MPEGAVDAVKADVSAVFAQREGWIAQLGIQVGLDDCSLLACRRSSLRVFAVQLEAVEAKRCELVQAELRRLVAKQTDIAHQLPDEIERTLQDEGALPRDC